MNKKLIFLVTTLLVAISAQAQSMRSLWVSLPDSLLPCLDQKTRTMMANAVGDTVTTTNGFSTKSLLVALTGDYLKATLTESSTIEIKRFSNPKGDSLVAVVNTFYGPEPESRLDIYDTLWKLQASNIQLDAGIERPDTMAEDEFEALKDKIEPVILIYRLSSEDDFLTVSYSLPMLSEADKQAIKPILREKKYKLPVLL